MVPPRRANRADLVAVQALDRALSPVFADQRHYEKLLLGPGVLMVADDSDGNLLGFAACSHVLDEATLLNLVVTPAHRQQGRAQQLLLATFAALRELGITRLMLEVRAGNAAARSLYDRCGFRRDGLRKRYYRSSAGAGEDALLMSLDLEVNRESA
jgi:ribosomal-protein-alanine N-acetyltransferase